MRASRFRQVANCRSRGVAVFSTLGALQFFQRLDAERTADWLRPQETRWLDLAYLSGRGATSTDKVSRITLAIIQAAIDVHSAAPRRLFQRRAVGAPGENLQFCFASLRSGESSSSPDQLGAPALRSERYLPIPNLYASIGGRPASRIFFCAASIGYATR